MRVQSLVLLATLALQGSVAQPAHRHTHLHKRSLQDVVEKRQPWDTSKDKAGMSQEWWDKQLKNKDWNEVFPNGKPAEGKPVVSEKYEESAKDSASEGKKADQKADDSKSSKGEETEKKAGDAKSSSSEFSGSKGNSDSDNKSDDDSSSTADCSDLSDLHVEGDNKSKRATVQQVKYKGNTGSSGYNSNIKPEKNCKPSGKYSLTIINEGETSDFWIWNKVGADGQPVSGMMGEGNQEFKLKKGQKAVFSFESNTQMGFSKAIGRAATRGNVPNGNVGEANFDDGNVAGGAKGSAYDVSMVTYNEIKDPARGPVGTPVLVPMTISRKGHDDSTTEKCVYTHDSQDSPVNPWNGKTCDTVLPSSDPFHITATFH